MICLWAGNLTANFSKTSNPHLVPCFPHPSRPRRLYIDRCIRTMPKSLAVSTCFMALSNRCSFEDSWELQETLWSSPDCKHLGSWKQPCNIASQLSFLYQFNVILPWSRAVISPPTLTRFWYRRTYHFFNGFKGAVRLEALFFRWFPALFLKYLAKIPFDPKMSHLSYSP